MRTSCATARVAPSVCTSSERTRSATSFFTISLLEEEVHDFLDQARTVRGDIAVEARLHVGDARRRNAIRVVDVFLTDDSGHVDLLYDSVYEDVLVARDRERSARQHVNDRGHHRRRERVRDGMRAREAV